MKETGVLELVLVLSCLFSLAAYFFIGNGLNKHFTILEAIHLHALVYLRYLSVAMINGSFGLLVIRSKPFVRFIEATKNERRSISDVQRTG